MKLLFITPQVPFPLDQGTKLRNYHLIRVAAEAGHEVEVLTFGAEVGGRPAEGGGRRAEEDEAPSALRPPPSAPLEQWCRRMVTVPWPRGRGLMRRAADIAMTEKPDLMLRMWSPGYARTLSELLDSEGFNVVQIEGLEMACYLPAAKAALTIFDDHNVEYLLQKRACLTDLRTPGRAPAALYSFIQWQRLRRWEARICRAANAVLAVSDGDAEALRELSRREVTNVSNGVDLPAIPFQPPPDESKPELLFDGVMSFRPNHDAATWFCREILPLVRQYRPDVRFWAVGRDPPPHLIRQNFARNGVAVTGWVPSVEPYWKRAALYVLPMRMGGGIRFKALQAMARGLPLVSTRLGVEGIAARPEHDCLLAEQPEEFAAAIVRLLDDPGLRRRLVASARETVAAHDWARIGPRLVEVYEGLSTRAAPGVERGAR